MKFRRASGILLHPTSLSNPFGIGDLGPAAYRWVDFLSASGCGLWQVLPLGPTGYGDSPYQCFSAFAGNPYLISPERLLEAGLLTRADLSETPAFPADYVAYGQVIPWKLGLLDRAFERFSSGDFPMIREELEVFYTEQSSWLEDFALFMAIKEAHRMGPWSNWPTALRMREPDALQHARQIHDGAIQRQIFRQFLFTRQWDALHSYATEHGVRIIGDLPIFVALDSADVWAHPELFFLDEDRKPTVVAGVPPDYFSSTGQLWGNPLFRWQTHQDQGYSWWLARLRSVLSAVDIIRLDHFRGFAGYWEVPAGEKTAVTGRWVPGPGEQFFAKVKDVLGELPIIAEDLGEITPDVVAMRERFNLPGMKILVFAFDAEATNPFLPHNYDPHFVVYTGTHDNDTVLGWYRRVAAEERRYCRRYLGFKGPGDVSWALVRAAWASVAVFALAPLQDLLGLGNEARMNYPGQPSGNWTWRMPQGALSETLIDRLTELNEVYGRTVPSPL